MTQMGAEFEESMIRAWGLTPAQARVATRGRNPAPSPGFDGMVEGFRSIGLTEAQAKRAAIGRNSSEAEARRGLDASRPPTASPDLADMRARLDQLEELLRLLPPEVSVAEVHPEHVGWVAVAEAGLASAEPRAPGRLRVRLIKSGWSKNDRYYSEAMLKRDGPRAFPAGTKMYADHDADEDSVGSVKNLAGVLTTAARWDEALGGLVAEATPVPPWGDSVAGWAAAGVGVSIRSWAEGEDGLAEGRKGWLVSALTEGRSVDFVVRAAAGGAILAA